MANALGKIRVPNAKAVVTKNASAVQVQSALVIPFYSYFARQARQGNTIAPPQNWLTRK
jgi:hypothetical protein